MRRSIAGALIAALLSGCVVGPDYHAPETPVPPAFVGPRPAGAAVNPAAWWRVFGDARLDALVTRALKDNPDIAVAAARVEEARLQEIVARAAYLPSVNASANATHIHFSKNAGISSLARAFGGGGTTGGGTEGGGTGSSDPGTGGGIALPGSGISTYSVGFDASWELDVFGGVQRSVEAARARRESAEWSRRDAAVMIAAEVAQGYFAFRLDQEQVSVTEAELQRQQGALRIAGNIAKVGLSPQIDVTRQRASITATEARLAPIRADMAVRRHALAILLALPPAALDAELTQPLPALAAVPGIPVGLPSDLLRRRPDVRAAERQLAASTADIGVAVADLYPKFDLTGMAQLISTTLRTLFSGDSLQVTGTAAAQFPLFDAGKRRATVKLREAQRDEAVQQYRTAVLSALRDVEDALVQIAAERERRVALANAVADSEESARATEAQYRTGFVAQDSLLNAQADVLSAREQLTASDAQLRQQTVALFKAVGGGWETAEPAAHQP